MAGDITYNTTYGGLNKVGVEVIYLEQTNLFTKYEVYIRDNLDSVGSLVGVIMTPYYSCI